MTKEFTVRDAVEHPDFLPTLRSELRRIFKEKEDLTRTYLLRRTPLDRLMEKGVFVYDDELMQTVRDVLEQRSDLSSGERSVIRHLILITFAKMGEKIKFGELTEND